MFFISFPQKQKSGKPTLSNKQPGMRKTIKRITRLSQKNNPVSEFNTVVSPQEQGPALLESSVRFLLLKAGAFPFFYTLKLSKNFPITKKDIKSICFSSASSFLNI
jgi:hypothetical protein